MASTGTGVTIGSRTIRVVQVRKQKDGSWQVTAALAAPLKGHEVPDARRVSEGRAAVDAAGVKGRTLVGLTGRDLIVRYTQVPPVPDWRLEMLMNFEIQEVSEQSGGDVSADYGLLEVDDTTSGDNVVLVALAKNGYLKPRLEALKGAGLDVLGGCPRAVGAFWSYKENGRLRHDETVVIMHIGHENTDVAIARQGVLLFARNVTGGSKMFTDALVENMRVNVATAEKLKITKGNLTPRGQARYRDSGEEKVANNLMGVGGHFVSAFNSSVMFAKAQTKVPDCAPDRLVLLGAGAQLRGLSEYMESNLGVPVELFDPMSDLDLSALAAEQQNAVRQEQGAMAAALGLAQLAADDDAFRVEVLPEADKKARHFKQHTLWLILAGVVLALAMIAAFVLAGKANSEAKAENAALKTRAGEFQKNFAEYTAERSKVKRVNDQNYRLRRQTALGPAYQRITDAVTDVISVGSYEQIYVENLEAAMKEVVRDGERDLFPEVEFHTIVESVGGRPVDSVITEFGTRVRSRLESMGGLTFTDIGTPEDLDGRRFRMKFRVRQEKFPELLGTDDDEAGDGSSDGE